MERLVKLQTRDPNQTGIISRRSINNRSRLSQKKKISKSSKEGMANFINSVKNKNKRNSPGKVKVIKQKPSKNPSKNKRLNKLVKRLKNKPSTHIVDMRGNKIGNSGTGHDIMT